VTASPIATWDPISGSRTALPHRAKTRVNDVTQVLAPHSLGLQVIAEGVEATCQLEELRALGCDHGQGYLLGRRRRRPRGTQCWPGTAPGAPPAAA
jgi:EAL domain-containing protein (putative c-di-GMP-specific phosphodiesterase class I)